MKEVIATPKAPAAVGPYSQGIKGAGLVFVSGQLPMDPETKTMPVGITACTARCLENCKAVLEAAGSGLDKVVKVTVLMQDLGQFKTMNEVYARYFPSNAPARAAFQVAALPLNADIEIEMIALA